MSKKWKIFQSNDEYMAQVAHDVRAPLAAIKFVLGQKILSEKKVCDATRTETHKSETGDLNQLTQEAVLRLESILGDLGREDEELEISSRQVSKPFQKASISDLVLKIVNEKKTLCHFDDGRRLSIQAKFDEASKVLQAAGPAPYLERCLSNIIDNALEAVPSSRDPKISISARCQGGEAIIRIRDNGVGIPSQILQILGRTPISYNKEGGSGRGLYFAHRFLQGVDGALEMRSAHCGKKVSGTEVIIRIPVLQ